MCRDQYNKTKLNRLLKRKSVAVEEASPLNTKLMHSMSTSLLEDTMIMRECFFREEVTSLCELTAASTFALDSKVSSLALCLKDQKLLVKLCSGDMIDDNITNSVRLAFVIGQDKNRGGKLDPLNMIKCLIVSFLLK